MARGQGRPARAARSLNLSRHRVVLTQGAEDDVREILDYVRSRSEQGAVTVEGEIFGKLEFLETMPEGAPVDASAPTFPQPEATGRRAIAGNYDIRYAYPVAYQGDEEVVLILFVRDARRDVLARPEIRQRFVDLVLEDIRARRETPSDPDPA